MVFAKLDKLGGHMNRGRPPRDVVYARLDTQIAELWNRMGGLPNPLEAEHIWRGIWYEEAHHSTAIEGNTLVLREVEQLLAEGRAVGDKTLKEYMEVKGYADAAEWVYGEAVTKPGWGEQDVIRVTEVRHVHSLAMSPAWDVAPHPEAYPEEEPGAFRRHDIQPFPAGMRPPSWVEIEACMVDWVKQANAVDARVQDFPERIAALHCGFERIHPFLDGNGRTGRLILNLVLVRLGYPPAIIYKNQCNTYLAALRRADTGDCGQLGEFIARAILDNLYKFIVPAVAGPARLVPIAALATREMKVGALRAAAVRGALNATKGPDGQWRSSRNWADEYIRTKHRRRD